MKIHTHAHTQKEISKQLANSKGTAEGAPLYAIKKPDKYTFWHLYKNLIISLLYDNIVCIQ
jgi:hypothetical protein